MNLPDRIDYGMAHYTDEPNPTPVTDAILFVAGAALTIVKIVMVIKWII